MRLRTNDKGQIEPEDPRELPFFRHCCEGMISVTLEYFRDSFVPVFVQHHPNRYIYLDGRIL